VPSRAEQRCLLGFHLDKSYELVQRQIGGKEEVMAGQCLEKK
jgi:hypothetical protein